MGHNVLSVAKLFLGAFIALTTATAPSSSSKATIPNDAAIQRASKISTGNPSNCIGSTSYFPQPVDHATFNGNYSDPKSTFLQQYILNGTFFKPGGPILFFQGAENPSMNCMEPSQIPAWAQELDALIISLEHRYFGISTPYGLNYTEHANWDPKLLKPLTIKNVLADSISFITWVKKAGFPAAAEAKVIAFGGSYGGTLAVRLRTHYSADIVGAIASSPVTKTIGGSGDPMSYAAMDWVNMVINDLSSEAASKIKNSFNDLRSRMKAGNFSGIQKALNLCTAPKSTDQTGQLISMVQYSYAIVTQYNEWRTKLPLTTAINATLQLNDSLSILGAATKTAKPWLSAILGSTSSDCVPWEAGVLDSIDPFNYLLCTDFPYIHYAYAQAGTIFGATAPPAGLASINNVWCPKTFPGIAHAVVGGERYDRANLMDDATLQNTKRLIISQGLYDPTTAYGPRPWLPGPTRDGSRVVYISGGSHTVDFAASNATYDLQSVREARVAELNSMKEWLGMT